MASSPNDHSPWPPFSANSSSYGDAHTDNSHPIPPAGYPGTANHHALPDHAQSVVPDYTAPPSRPVLQSVWPPPPRPSIAEQPSPSWPSPALVSSQPSWQPPPPPQTPYMQAPPPMQAPCQHSSHHSCYHSTPSSHPHQSFYPPLSDPPSPPPSLPFHPPSAYPAPSQLSSSHSLSSHPPPSHPPPPRPPPSHSHPSHSHPSSSHPSHPPPSHPHPPHLPPSHPPPSHPPPSHPPPSHPHPSHLPPSHPPPSHPHPSHLPPSHPPPSHPHPPHLPPSHPPPSHPHPSHLPPSHPPPSYPHPSHLPPSHQHPSHLPSSHPPPSHPPPSHPPPSHPPPSHPPPSHPPPSHPPPSHPAPFNPPPSYVPSSQDNACNSSSSQQPLSPPPPSYHLPPSHPLPFHPPTSYPPPCAPPPPPNPTSSLPPQSHHLPPQSHQWDPSSSHPPPFFLPPSNQPPPSHPPSTPSSTSNPPPTSPSWHSSSSHSSSAHPHKTHTHHPPHHSHQPPPYVPSPIPSHASIPRPQSTAPSFTPLLSRELLQQMRTRVFSARRKLSNIAVQDACKGLSRLIQIDRGDDIELFAHQLRASDRAASQRYSIIDNNVPCFAISYVQHAPVGRFKFSAAQWINLKVALAEIVSSGVRRCHLWIDQCLWLNDASQTSWAHTGLIPYVMWPVVTLGSKKFDNDKTVESNTRMWPFVEEIAALWGMGLLTTQEMRSTKVESGSRRHVSYSQRCRLEPEESMRMLLVNVFHGAIDDLQTGWVDDVQELKEMARWNVNADNEHVIVGSDWRSRIAKIDCVSPCSIPYSLTMPFQRKTWSGGFEGNNQYIDGSRKYFGSTWDGLREWLSGNSPARPADEFEDISSIRMSKINVITDRGEYQLLRIDNQYGEPQALWLLVVMDGRSSNFSRGHVAWTKIMCGLSSCELQGAVGDDNVMVTERILSEQVGFAVNIISMKEVDEDIEWT